MANTALPLSLAKSAPGQTDEQTQTNKQTNGNDTNKQTCIVKSIT